MQRNLYARCGHYRNQNGETIADKNEEVIEVQHDHQSWNNWRNHGVVYRIQFHGISGNILLDYHNVDKSLEKPLVPQILRHLK